MTGQRPPRSTCRSCGELIFWASTDQGKMPVDDEPDPAGNLLLTPGLYPKVTVVSQGGRAPGTALYRSHFASCSEAQRHRKPVSARRVAPPAVPQEGLFSHEGLG